MSDDKHGDFTPVIKVDLKRADVEEIVRGDVLLASCPFIQSLGTSKMLVLARAIARRCEDKVVIFQKDDVGDALFLVLKGEVRLFARKETDGVEVGTARRGDVIGEGEVLSGASVRSTSAVAQGATELAEFPRGAFLHKGALRDGVRRFLEEVHASRSKTLEELNDFMKRW